MRSTVTKLYDYRSEPVPEALTRWHIPDGEIRERLAVLSRAHARETAADTVEKGDGVRCVRTDGTGGSVLLFPGRGLPGAAGAEQAVLGKRIGERFETAIGERALALEVAEIRRRCPAEINDDLIRLEKIEQVETLEDYARWYREENEPARKQQAAANIAIHWQQLLAERSSFAIDEAEQTVWAERNARRMYDSMLAAGKDPHIPDEGVTFLTAQQAIAKLADQYMPNYKYSLVIRALARQRGICLDSDYLERRYAQIAEFRKISLEQAKADAPAELLLDTDYSSKVYELLTAEAQPLLEV